MYGLHRRADGSGGGGAETRLKIIKCRIKSNYDFIIQKTMPGRSTSDDDMLEENKAEK